ncbi:MAG: hypothetical protein L0H84_22285 [Pseudonocardia sp.]|nr:hypothetical protein [Pseudonocardia sp.]
MSDPDRPLSAAQAESLVAASEPWMSCDDCFDQIDGYAEVLIQDGRAPSEPLRVHLSRCPACFAEAETLISLAATDRGVSSERALDRFRTAIAVGDLDGQVRPRNAVARLLRRYRDVERGGSQA